MSGKRVVVFGHQDNTNYNHKKSVDKSLTSRSADTIYRNTVEKRMSSSSDEPINTSDEICGFVTDDTDFQPDYEDVVEAQVQLSQPVQPQLGPSFGIQVHQASQPRIIGPNRDNVAVGLMAEEKAAQMVINAENSKVRVFPNTGRNDGELIKQACTTTMMDEEYMVIGAHVDENTRNKIAKGEYIDFGKLLPKDRLLVEDEGKLELVIRNGKTFWVPVSEVVTINSISRWEQAFRIFANI